ncbi:MAG: urate hydroxylase PuuD [Nitrospirota bacterium]|nr:urate hydroxylase PuuD [Nitrospirota bacterium]
MDHQATELIVRWFHFLAGIMWIGLLYYFNFVQGAFLKAASPEAKADAFKNLVPRALLFFRWASVLTVLFGLSILGQRHILVQAYTFQGGAAVIGMGAWLGTIMMLNVWGFIWPNQKRVIGLVPAEAAEKAKAARIAFLASRVNVVLSIPMLFFMGASSHGAALFINH